MGESQNSQDASRFRALGNGVSGAGQGSAGDRELHNGTIASQAAWAYPNGGRSLDSKFGLYDTSFGSNQHFGFSHSGNLYDEQSLSFAFEGMSFSSRTPDVPTSHRNVPLTNGHYPSGRVDGTLNQQHAPATLQDDDSLRLQFSVQHAMQHTDVEHQEQSHRFPPQLGKFSRSSGLHSFDSNLGVPCHPSTASEPFQQMWQSQMYTPHDQNQNVGSNFMWQQNMGVQPYSIMQPNYVCPQLQQVPGFGASRHRSNEQYAVSPPANGPSSSYLGTPNVHWLENGYSYLNGAAFQKRRNSGGLNNTFADSFPSTSYTGSSCGSGDFRHFQRAEKVFNPYGPHHQQADNLAHPYGLGFSHHQISDKLNTASYPERILMRPDVGNSVKDFDLSPYAHLLKFLSSKSDTYKSIDEVMGRVCILSKDQDACRFLQKVLTEGTQEDIDKIFSEIIDNVGDLMVDPTAHYLVQKILEVCTDDQRTHLIREITKAPITLHKASCNMHGTRVVQKVIDTMNTSDQVSMVVSTLNTGIMRFMTDSYGSHVALHCLQKLLPDHKAFLLEAAASRYLQLAKDRHGCCVLQKCIEHSSDGQRNNLLCKITSSALALSEDQYGNYVIQFILALNIEWATTRIVNELAGHFGNLSVQKCGSHVVEHCLKLAPRLLCDTIIDELMQDPKLLHIILDQYGNFVIQTALKQCQGKQHTAFVETIRPHTAVLQSNMYGKRVLSRTCLKNKHCRFGFY
ncbi:putative pumilio homolog 8, chloroplastic [Miscanthus floridulus]|uniref:putative pumilio homolog 8, chloroplastic n=1 Tax=Miscanthus floridulus TaxID=154761 RepID=UPI003457C12A